MFLCVLSLLFFCDVFFKVIVFVVLFDVCLFLCVG